MAQVRNVAILIFEKVDVLDFSGPLEVFSISSDVGKDFKVYTVAAEDRSILTSNDLSVNPAYTIENCPEPDILIIPGGIGIRDVIKNPNILSWINSVAFESELVMSVCTGALLLAKANLLYGLKVTTHHSALHILRKMVSSSTEVVEGVRYVDNGKIVCSAGVSAGIDMSLYVVSRLLGKERAITTAKRMEYEWNSN